MKDSIIIKNFGALTPTELYEILRLRAKVFVVEQNCPYQDLDGVDYDSIHLFTLREDGSCASCCRIFPDEAHPGDFRIGRLIADERRMGHGMRLLLACIDECARRRATAIRLNAQQYALGFYEKAGFSVCSELFYEENIPHFEMIKTL